MISAAAAMCMALTIYHEARGEPLAGQAAVGYVLYRRADFDQDLVCHETYRRNQFEWTKNPKKVTMQQLEPYVILSAKILNHEIRDGSRGAEFFHNINMPNPWGMKPKITINNHVFY